MAEKKKKITKDEAKYQEKPNVGRFCGICDMFHAWKCDLVKGTISYDGYCKF